MLYHSLCIPRRESIDFHHVRMSMTNSIYWYFEDNFRSEQMLLELFICCKHVLHHIWKRCAMICGPKITEYVVCSCSLGNMVQSILDFGWEFFVLWLSGIIFLLYVSLALWLSISLALWLSGSQSLWLFGSRARWLTNSVVFLLSGFPTLRLSGSLALWLSGSLGPGLSGDLALLLFSTPAF